MNIGQFEEELVIEPVDIVPSNEDRDELEGGRPDTAPWTRRQVVARRG
jgi:hypothetical protein